MLKRSLLLFGIATVGLSSPDEGIANNAIHPISLINPVKNFNIFNQSTTNQTPQISTASTTAETLTATATNNPSDSVNIVAVGDVMIGSNFPNDGFLPPNDAKDSFKAVLPYLKGDVVFGNLEGAILDNGISTKCPPQTDKDQEITTAKTTEKPTATKTENTNTEKAKPRTCYAFRMPERYAQILKNAGFNLMSLANNHVGDFGDVGRQKTVENLTKVGIHHAGLLSKPTDIFEQNGVKYGFVAFAPNIGTVNINDLANAKNLVKNLEKQVDIVIVSFHGGAEGAEYVHVPKTMELYLNEKRGNVYELAHSLIDVGADVVIGHGPHVTRGVELYKNRFIAYSLGNFNTYGAFNVRGLNGIAPLINITMNKNGEFLQADVVSIQQTKEKGLQLDPKHQAFGELKRLTALDFPDTPLMFEQQKILKK
ncbi:CapA family protein [Faucicola boevrei]|uniref:CapA family protein n=1 Tax=Faucicola boevrei TaxID=346665 RepID=UPI0003608F29|nr:CapA family protein [Moraxella boevrei]